MRQFQIAIALICALLVVPLLSLPATVAAAGNDDVCSYSVTTSPNQLVIDIGGCAYQVDPGQQQYTITVSGPGFSERIYKGNGGSDVPGPKVLKGLNAGKYTIKSSGLVLGSDNTLVPATGSTTWQVPEAATPPPSAKPTPRSSPTARPSSRPVHSPIPSPHQGSPSPKVTAHPSGIPAVSPSASPIPSPSASPSLTPCLAHPYGPGPSTSICPSPSSAPIAASSLVPIPSAAASGLPTLSNPTSPTASGVLLLIAITTLIAIFGLGLLLAVARIRSRQEP